MWLVGGVLGTVYSGLNGADRFITVNYSVNTSLNLLTLLLKIYYYCKITKCDICMKKSDENTIELPVID